MSNISEYVDIDNFKGFLKDKGINAVNVEYLLDEQKQFAGQSIVTVAHEEKEKSLEALNKLSIFGKKLEVIKEKDMQNRDPKANIYVFDIHPKVTPQMFYHTFKNFGMMESCRLMTNTDGSSKGFGFVQYKLEASAERAI